MITILNYESYQDDDRQHVTDVTGKRQADDRQATTNKNEKNENTEKNEREGSPTLFNFCLKILPEVDHEDFKKKPELVIGDEFSQIWIDRKGLNDDPMFKAWAKFFNHHLQSPGRNDWLNLWTNWVINEVVYDKKKNWA